MKKLSLPKVFVPKFNKSKVLKVALLVLVVVALGVLAGGVYSHWQTIKTNNNAVEAAKVADQKKKDDQVTKTLSLVPKYRTVYTNERINCEKGLAIYNALPPSTKKTIKAVPTCGPAVLDFDKS